MKNETFTRLEGEITVFSNITAVKERASRKMKIQTAMLGENLVYMFDQSTSKIFQSYIMIIILR